MQNPETLTLFRRLIEQEIACSERLHDILVEERQALSSHAPDPLLEAVSRKQAAIKALEQSVTAHEGFLAARRLPPGKKGTEAFLNGLPDNAPERTLWKRLQEIAARCREHNQSNGSMVALGRVRTQRALDILKGGDNSGRTYGRAGNTRNAAAQRFLATA